MAHEITHKDVFGEVRAQGRRAWHGLGVELPEHQTTWQAFQGIGLDWETEMVPMTAQVGDLVVDIPEHLAHVRVDTGDVLGVVNKQYKPISNRSLAEFTDSLVSAGQVSCETAGSLRMGKVIFTCVRLPQDIEVVDGDILHQYILVRNAHDGLGAFQAYPTSVRVVCANTLRMSERDSERGLRFHHMGDVKSKIEEAKLILGIVDRDTKRFAAKVKLLADRTMTVQEVRDYFVGVYQETFPALPEPDSKLFERQLARRTEILAAWEANMEDERQTIPGIRGTAWAAYNAISQWHDHSRGYFKGVDSDDRRVHSNLFGAAHAEKTKAFQSAVGLL